MRTTAAATASVPRAILTGAAAAAIGLVAWLAMVASAPTASDGAAEDFGDDAFFVVLLVIALAAGFVLPAYARLTGAMLGLPALVLSPWTAPRGDNDGLWLLIVPYLAVFVVVLVATAGAGGWLRRRATRAA